MKRFTVWREDIITYQRGEINVGGSTSEYSARKDESRGSAIKDRRATVRLPYGIPVLQHQTRSVNGSNRILSLYRRQRSTAYRGRTRVTNTIRSLIGLCNPSLLVERSHTRSNLPRGARAPFLKGSVPCLDMLVAYDS
jgi:hypothetical protein